MFNNFFNISKYLIKFIFSNKELFKYLKLIFFLINNGDKLMKYNYEKDIKQFIANITEQILAGKGNQEILDFVNHVNKSNIDFNGFLIDEKNNAELSLDIFGQKVILSRKDGSIKVDG